MELEPNGVAYLSVDTSVENKTVGFVLLCAQ